jgi:hypothetical protein
MDHDTQLMSYLCYNSIDIAGAVMLTNILNLSGNHSMTSIGQCALADLLKPTLASKLKDMRVSDLHDATLAGNTALERMHFFSKVFLKISGCFAILDSLYDKTSIVGTYNSNHIYLPLNSNKEKAKVAQKKIINLF